MLPGWEECNNSNHMCVCVCVLFEFVGRTIGASPKEIYQSLILLFFIHWGGIWFQMLIVESCKIIRWIVLNGYDDYNRFGWSSHAFWLWFQCTIQTHTCVCVWKRLIEIVKKYIFKKKWRNFAKKVCGFLLLLDAPLFWISHQCINPKFMLFFCFLAPVCCCPFFLSFHHSRPPLKSFSSFKSDQETFFLSFYLGVKMVRKKPLFFMCDWLLIFVYMFSLKGEERKDR